MLLRVRNSLLLPPRVSYLASSGSSTSPQRTSPPKQDPGDQETLRQLTPNFSEVKREEEGKVHSPPSFLASERPPPSLSSWQPDAAVGSLPFLYGNIQGLRTALPSIRSQIAKMTKKPALLLFNETQVSSRVAHEELKIDGFSLQRSDFDSRIHFSLAAYVQSGLVYDRLFELESDFQEVLPSLWLRVNALGYFKKSDPSFVFGLLYRSPQPACTSWVLHLQKALKAARRKVKGPMILAGDFNVDLLRGGYDARTYLRNVGAIGLTQVVEKPTRVASILKPASYRQSRSGGAGGARVFSRSETCIDHIWVSEGAAVNVGRVSLPSDHYGLVSNAYLDALKGKVGGRRGKGGEQLEDTTKSPSLKKAERVKKKALLEEKQKK